MTLPSKLTPDTHRLFKRLAPALALAAVMAGGPLREACAASPWGPDVVGGQDHPLVQRFAGSWLVAYRQQAWESVQLPLSQQLLGSDKLKDTVSAEGQLTRLVYLSPRGKAPLEVYRNYESALLAAGFKRRFACEKACERLFFAWTRQLQPDAGLSWSNGSVDAASGRGSFKVDQALSPGQGRLWVGSLSRNGAEVQLLLYTAEAVNDSSDVAVTLLQIVEPKAMPGGQVTVDAKALNQGLASDGHIALGGLLFDSGRADLKPESRPQLEEMAKLLRSQPRLKVFIVGHTDNVGGFDTNLTLSQARAQAVVQALSQAPYNIEAGRLSAKGLANMAPQASNADEAGRAKNRRVELVAQ